jgi:hypothetical protein
MMAKSGSFSGSVDPTAARMFHSPVSCGCGDHIQNESVTVYRPAGAGCLDSSQNALSALPAGALRDCFTTIV